MLLTRHVAIIGGGFSGTLLAINLLRDGGVAVTLIEREAARLARGLAYGAAQAGHILNVRAANMSAFADEPEHFVDWLAQRGTGSEMSFASRTDYGTYLAALLAQARRAAPERLTVVQDEAIDLEDRGHDMLIRLGSGEALAADHVVIASGNLPPHDLSAFAGLSAPAYVSDPWSPGSADGLDDGDIVMLLGTGLTAVDCALTLDHAGFRGRIVALSRRGLAPRRHGPADSFTPLRDRPGQLDSRLVQAVRARSRAVGWRNAVDELRPFTRDIWDGASADQRARFLRHLRPYWDIHRHRIAPPVAERIDGMAGEDRLEFAAGKIVSASARGDGARGRLASARRGDGAAPHCPAPHQLHRAARRPAPHHRSAASAARGQGRDPAGRLCHRHRCRPAGARRDARGQRQPPALRRRPDDARRALGNGRRARHPHSGLVAGALSDEHALGGRRGALVWAIRVQTAVTPAQAGVHPAPSPWTPACAGVTAEFGWVGLQAANPAQK